MNIEFVLLASGSSVTPRIAHAIFEKTEAMAKEEAVRVVKQLSMAGYFMFDLFNVSQEVHVRVESYRVETAEPTVKVI
jgi:hypothetical protein